MRGLRKVFSPLALIVNIISDSNEEEVEVRIIEPKAFQLVGLEHPEDFSLEPILEGFFEVEPDFPNIHVVVPHQTVV